MLPCEPLELSSDTRHNPTSPALADAHPRSAQPWMRWLRGLACRVLDLDTEFEPLEPARPPG